MCCFTSASHQESDLLSESANEVLERLVVAVLFQSLNCHEELTDEVVAVRTELVLDEASGGVLNSRCFWVVELLRVWVVRVLELEVSRLGLRSVAFFRVASESVKCHCSMWYDSHVFYSQRNALSAEHFRTSRTALQFPVCYPGDTKARGMSPWQTRCLLLPSGPTLKRLVCFSTEACYIHNLRSCFRRGDVDVLASI